MVVAVHPNELVVVHNWTVRARIPDLNPANISKYWIQPMPRFDAAKFPFLVCSGEATFNLVNVRDFTQDVLIQATGKNFRSQQAAFFQRGREGDFRMHFATRTITAENKRRKEWHCMSFKEDFVQMLTETGRLPISSMKEQQKLL